MKTFSEFTFEKKSLNKSEQVSKPTLVEKNITKNKIETEIKNSVSNIDIVFEGKIAKFPKNFRPSDAIKFLEKKNIDKNKLHFIITENNGDSIIVLKNNPETELKLKLFCENILMYYKNNKLDIGKIIVEGEDSFAIIKNISKNLIAKLENDIIKILSK